LRKVRDDGVDGAYLGDRHRRVARARFMADGDRVLADRRPGAGKAAGHGWGRCPARAVGGGLGRRWSVPAETGRGDPAAGGDMSPSGTGQPEGRRRAPPGETRRRTRRVRKGRNQRADITRPVGGPPDEGGAARDARTGDRRHRPGPARSAPCRARANDGRRVWTGLKAGGRGGPPSQRAGSRKATGAGRLTARQGTARCDTGGCP